MSRIIRLESENVRKLKAIRVDAAGKPIVHFRGKNKQGKSSALDSIIYALGGKRTHPPDLIREGETYARVLLETDLLIVERKWHRAANGEVTSHLDVTSKDGAATFRSPQAMLDNLTSRFWDPIAFLNLKPAEQAEVLRGLIGVDFGLLNGKRQKAYDDRADVNREIVSITKRLEAMPLFAVKPEKADVTALIAERNANVEATRKHEAARAALARRSTEAALEASRAANAVKAAEAALTAAYAAQERATAELAQVNSEAAAFFANPAPVVRTDELDAKIAAVTDQNMAVARFEERAGLEARLLAESAKSDAFTAEIKAIDKQKEDALKQARFPIPGLGFREDGITLNGFALAVASQAEQIAFACAVGWALNPELKVLMVRNASLVDEDGLKLLEELAEKEDGQIFMEHVGTAGVGLLFVDGEIVSVTEAEGAAP